MSHPLPYCQCPRGNAPCGHDITQEDLLCDDCRAGRCFRKGAAASVLMQALSGEEAALQFSELRVEWRTDWDGPRWPPPCQD